MKIQGTLFKDFGCVVHGNGNDPRALKRDDVKKALIEYGAILFRGFDADVVRFKEFTDQCCSQFITHTGVAVRGKFDEFGKDYTLTEVTVGENDLALHGEMFHSPSAPEVIWFYCQDPAPIGGQTTLADANKLYLALPKEIQSLFESKKLRYKHYEPPQVWQPRYGTESLASVIENLKTEEGTQNIHADENNNLVYDYVTSAIRVSKFGDKKVFLNNIFITRNPANSLKDAPTIDKKMGQKKAIDVEFEDGTPISDDILLEVFKAGTSITQDIEWQPSDFVMVDNTRLLHGRRAFKGKRRIATRIAAAA